jgi:hypothetical protein
MSEGRSDPALVLYEFAAGGAQQLELNNRG